MSFSNLMRNAAKILFFVSIFILLATLIFTLFAAGEMGNPLALLAGVAGAFGAAALPFAGAAIIWRLDIWLFERSESS